MLLFCVSALGVFCIVLGVVFLKIGDKRFKEGDPIWDFKIKNITFNYFFRWEPKFFPLNDQTRMGKYLFGFILILIGVIFEGLFIYLLFT